MDHYGSRTLPTPSRIRRSYSDRATGIPKIPTRFGMTQQVFNKAMSYNNNRSIVEDQHGQKKDNNNNDDNSKLKRTVIVIKGRKRLQSAPESNCIEENSEENPNKNHDSNRKSHHKFNNGNITSPKERTATRKRLSATTTVLDPFINDQDTSEERIQVDSLDFELFADFSLK